MARGSDEPARPPCLTIEGDNLMWGERVLWSSSQSLTKQQRILEVKERLEEAYPNGTEDFVEMEQKVIRVLRTLPAVLTLENSSEAAKIIQNYFKWEESKCINIAILVCKRTPQSSLGCGSVGKQLSCTYISGFMTCFEKGECAKASNLDTSFPKALQAEGIPTNELFLDPSRLVEHFDVSSCTFDLIPEGCAEPLNLSFPCAILKLKGFPLSYLTTGALIKCCSAIDGSDSSYDDPLCMGALMSEGETFLRNSGPERHSVVLGITDMRSIQWFRITRSNVGGHFKVAKGLATTDISGSICGFMHAKPFVLGVKINLAVHRLPSSWRVLKHIGSGLTSHVYSVVSASRRLAVKVPKFGFDLSDDIENLEALAGVEGVPKIHQKIHSMIALEPVGQLFSPKTLAEYEAKGFRLSLVDLVVILDCAHQRGIVNRDLRPQNIMIGESLSNAGKPRLYILDWGFATKSNKACSFSGSVVTASDHVLKQLSQQKRCALTCIVVSPNDDLVSLVRCLFLTFHCQIYADLWQIAKDPEMIRVFWQQQMECNHVWRNAEEDALHLRYESLKKFFTCMPDVVTVQEMPSNFF